MGIEHRMKDETNDSFWKCPFCNAVSELLPEFPKGKRLKCLECEQKCCPHDNPATWEDFWVYCQSLKHI
jgi:hypothetical protein